MPFARPRGVSSCRIRILFPWVFLTLAIGFTGCANREAPDSAEASRRPSPAPAEAEEAAARARAEIEAAQREATSAKSQRDGARQGDVAEAMPKIAARMEERAPEREVWITDQDQARQPAPAGRSIQPPVEPVPRMATGAAAPEGRQKAFEPDFAPAMAAPPGAPAAPVTTESRGSRGSDVERDLGPAPAVPSPAPAAAAAPEGQENKIALDQVPAPASLMRRLQPAPSPAPPPPPRVAAKVAAAPPAAAKPPSAPAAAKPPAAGARSTEELTVVKVFYGTDRAAMESGSRSGLSASFWYWITSAAAILTMALAMGCWQWPSSRSLRWSSALGIVATVGLGLVTIQARQEGEASEAPARRVYGNRRGSLELGTCEVSIPKGHQVGVVERPTVFKLQFAENPLKHVVLQSVRQQPVEEFYADMKTRVDSSERKEAFVFVHGFNVNFDSAARRTAQIAHDLKFDGAPIFFSWPSQGGLFGYTVDETNVVWTVPHLKQFLFDVSRQSGAQGVHLVAHSMGNRALTSALREMLYELNDQCPRFREVVLTAPDVDAEVFRRDLAPAIVRTADRVTLYASSNDEALVLSKKVHGYARAGDSGAGLIVLPGMDTIDVSAVDTSLLGHSYYGNNLTVLADLLDLLHGDKPAESRPWLRPIRIGQLRYWIFKHVEAAARGREQM